MQLGEVGLELFGMDLGDVRDFGDVEMLDEGLQREGV